MIVTIPRHRPQVGSQDGQRPQLLADDAYARPAQPVRKPSFLERTSQRRDVLRLVVLPTHLAIPSTTDGVTSTVWTAE